jgi:hypothetical protein
MEDDPSDPKIMVLASADMARLARLMALKI